ncbi:Clavaminate synthase-like protein [Thozetella sp. PMI_491]|nr:Clavaminate synthase-like protein [Thozetella sp. PMI_491]
MAPHASEAAVQDGVPASTPISSSRSRLSGPLKCSGSLDSYEQFDVTAVIGRESPKLQLSEIHQDETQVRDLAILVSQRGVVFFRNQDLDVEKQLGQKLGELTGKPETSKLHRHALSNSKRGIAVDENGKLNDEVSGWHADITLENIPSDYAILKLAHLPGEVDRLSPIWQKFAEETFGNELIDDYRGAPENKSLSFRASHPVVRTNPVTGWMSLFDDVSEEESRIIKEYFLRLITDNHDLRVRFRWQQNDVAIWDNRSRQDNRVVSLGEKPHYSPNTVSRREALSLA